MITIKPGQGVRGEGLEELWCAESGSINYTNTSGKKISTGVIHEVSPLLIKRLLVNFSSDPKSDSQLYLHRHARIKDIREFSPAYWDRSTPDTLAGDFTFLVEIPARLGVRVPLQENYIGSLWMELTEFILSVNVQKVGLVNWGSENHFFKFSNIKKAVVESPHIFRGFEADAITWSDINNFGVNSALKEYWESLKDLPRKWKKR